MSSPNGGAGTAPAPARKPKQKKLLKLGTRPSAVATCLRCECTEADHRKPSHFLECACEEFQHRPCKCGHAHSMHTGVCNGRRDDGRCTCKGYHLDPAPAFLLRNGIRSGEWQFMTTPQLKWAMRPENELKIRVWACGMLHSIGYRRLTEGENQHIRMAVRLVGKDAYEPLTPSDIVKELNELDSIGRATDQSVRRAMAELERDGAMRRAGRTKGQVRLFFYLRPLTAKQIPIESDQNDDGSDSNETTSVRTPLSHFEGVVVKGFLGALRKELTNGTEILVTPDQKAQIEKLLEPALILVKQAYFDAIKLVKNGTTYKEVSSYSNSGDPAASSSSLRSTPTTGLVDQPSAPEHATTSSPQPASEQPDQNPFDQALARIFGDAKKPGPTAKQCEVVRKLLPEQAQADYLESFNPKKMDRIEHAGVLETDARAFLQTWNAKRDREREEAASKEKERIRAEQEAAENQARMDYEDFCQDAVAARFEALLPDERDREMAEAERELKRQGRWNRLAKKRIETEKRDLVQSKLRKRLPGFEEWLQTHRRAKGATA